MSARARCRAPPLLRPIATEVNCKMEVLRMVNDSSTGFASLVLICGAVMFMLLIAGSLRLQQDGDKRSSRS